MHSAVAGMSYGRGGITKQALLDEDPNARVDAVSKRLSRMSSLLELGSFLKVAQDKTGLMIMIGALGRLDLVTFS